jgi:glycosyltransferase involved in cell wall biosynthesis
MHICFLCSEYPPGQHGGLGSVMQTLGRALVIRGHAVTIVGLYPLSREVEESDEGVRVIRLPHARISRTGFVVNSWRLRQALARIHQENPIHVLEGPELSLAMLPRSSPVLRVIRMHGGHHFFSRTLGKRPRLWRSLLERRSFGRADRVCAVSRFVAETTRELLHLKDQPIEILENPVNSVSFSPRREVPEDPNLIVFVGTVCEKKGIRPLLEAMPGVVAAFPSARLRVIGRDSHDVHGSSFTQYLCEAMPAQIRLHVEFLGAVAQAELPTALAPAAVCAYPSYSEAHSVACLEAMAMEKAIVGSNLPPFPDIVQNGVSGMLCDPHSPRAIAETLKTLLSDAQLRQRLGLAARQRVVERYSVETLVERNIRFYEQCLHFSGAHKAA